MELYHWGIKGMKWGVRRYQNKDGSLTPAGKKRVQKYSTKIEKRHSQYESTYATANKYRDEYSNFQQKINDINTGSKIKDSFSAYALKNKRDYALRNASSQDDRAAWYRDSSKKLIKQVSKIDPKCGEELTKKYSSMMDKVFLKDFTVKELQAIQKHPDNLSEKAQKYMDQMMDERIGKQSVSSYIKRIESEELMRDMIDQQMLNDQLMIQQAMHQQMLFDTQNMIDQDVYSMMGVM